MKALLILLQSHSMSHFFNSTQTKQNLPHTKIASRYTKQLEPPAPFFSPPFRCRRASVERR